ncbi:hypothetical protein GCM10022284_44340 [Streptomyces hundungensis]
MCLMLALTGWGHCGGGRGARSLNLRSAAAVRVNAGRGRRPGRAQKTGGHGDAVLLLLLAAQGLVACRAPPELKRMLGFNAEGAVSALFGGRTWPWANRVTTGDRLGDHSQLVLALIDPSRTPVEDNYKGAGVHLHPRGLACRARPEEWWSVWAAGVEIRRHRLAEQMLVRRS